MAARLDIKTWENRIEAYRSIGLTAAGERRYQAAKLAGLTEIPAISIESNDADKVALIENILRQDLTPLEEAEALQRLKDKYKYSNEKLAQVFTKSPSNISETLLITKLPDTKKKIVETGLRYSSET